jgi:hypothetical protein
MHGKIRSTAELNAKVNVEICCYLILEPHTRGEFLPNCKLMFGLVQPEKNIGNQVLRDISQAG